MYESKNGFRIAYIRYGRWVVGKSDFEENPKSDLDLDLGFVNIRTNVLHTTFISDAYDETL